MEKERRTKALLLSTLVVVVATLSIAFAAMSRTLNINGIGKMDTASWSVYFANLSDAKITRGAQEIGKPSISDDKGIVQDINVKLSNPKDEISYTVDIVNDGTIDAEITMIKDIELTDVQKKVFEFKVTYTDTGEILKDGDILPKKTTKNITINIKFKDDITEFDLPTESQTINLSYQITYTQYDGEIPIGPNGGDVITEKAILAAVDLAEAMSLEDPSTYHVYNGPIQRKSVESITFLSSNVVPVEYESTSWDASEAKDETVMAWYADSDTNGLNEVYIGGNGGVYAPVDSSALFAVFINLTEINFNNNFNTSDVTNMYGMFSVCTSLVIADFNKWNTSSVTNMVQLFIGCESLTNIDLSSFNTTNVTNMSYMFNGCKKLLTLNLNIFNTSSVTDMTNMFYNCESLTELDLSSFETSNVISMNLMFSSCLSLTNLDLSNFDTSKVETMESMFEYCSSLENINLNSWDTSKVTNMGYMFCNCTSLTSLNLSSFNTSKVTDMYSMFEYCSSLTILDLRNADFSNVTYHSNMFGEKSILSCEIIVKDETQREILTSWYPELTSVVLTSEL